MIRSLRRRHLQVFAVLSVALPTGFAAALMARPRPPVIDSMPSELVASVRTGETVVRGVFEILDDHALDAKVVLENQEPYLILSPREDPRRPDVLLYAAPRSAPFLDSGLPEGATLLGTLAGGRERTFRLPEWVFDSPSRFVLYSLPHQEVLGGGTLPAIER